MKKLLFTLALMLLPLLASAQSTKSKVVLKNGTELTGIIKSIDPTDAVKIVIAGVETSIKMADIAKIEELDQMPSNMPSSTNVQTKLNEKLRVTDFTDYPESFDLKVGDQNIKMILVRGGDMNMGYNGRNSLKYKSEPIHLVKISSFYISEGYIPSIIAKKVDEKYKDKKDPFYSESSYEKQKAVADYIANESKIPVRISTEAEWEYAACSDKQEEIFGINYDFEKCSDWFDSYEYFERILDPIGPPMGKRRVVRSYGRIENKFDRSHFVVYSKVYTRLVVKAKEVFNK